VAYVNLGQTDKAVAMYQQAIKIRPEATGPYNNLGVIFQRQGKLQEAEKMFRKALELHPGNAAAQRNLRRLQQQKSPAAVGAAR
jgi:Tfp pilus assembly protein PilF